MKLRIGLFDVQIGYNKRDVQEDNWRGEKVLAPTALRAARRVKLFAGEYIVGVQLLHRISQT